MYAKSHKEWAVIIAICWWTRVDKSGCVFVATARSVVFMYLSVRKEALLDRNVCKKQNSSTIGPRATMSHCLTVRQLAKTGQNNEDGITANILKVKDLIHLVYLNCMRIYAS